MIIRVDIKEDIKKWKDIKAYNLQRATDFILNSPYQQSNISITIDSTRIGVYFFAQLIAIFDVVYDTKINTFKFYNFFENNEPWKNPLTDINIKHINDFIKEYHEKGY